LSPRIKFCKLMPAGIVLFGRWMVIQLVMSIL
jgi:hypothetical protein